MKLILASGSPRRIELFRAHGYEPEIIPSGKEERVPEGLTPAETVLFLSLLKARSVEETLLPADEGTFLVAADTIVFLPENADDPIDVPAPHGPRNGTYRGTILGKPHDEEDAKLMLRNLANTANYVLTGVTVLEAGKPNRRAFVSVSRVDMMDYGEDYVTEYVASGEPMDKAGGYALQGRQACKIIRVDGSETNVIGLPWEETEAALLSLGYKRG